MRFLVDESAGAAVARFLRDEGHDVVAVAEAMPMADDAVILLRAATDQSIVVTNDKDFGELVFQSGQAMLEYCCCDSRMRAQPIASKSCKRCWKGTWLTYPAVSSSRPTAMCAFDGRSKARERKVKGRSPNPE